MVSVPVLLYHCIAPNREITPAGFERQLEYLSCNGYRTVPLQNFRKFLNGDMSLPARTVLITFDDGYADNWICAYPLLKRYGFTASVFVTTGRVINAPARKTISEGGQPPPFTGQHAGAFLSWEELRRMAESGVFEIGSHTRTHNDFNKHKSWPDMPAELVDSANEIFEKTGNRPDTLSWPWGYSTPELAKCALDVGYKMAFAAKPGSNTPRTDKFFVRRFTVRMGDVNWLARRLWLYSHPLLASAYGSMYRIV